jgi:hypothetical protein
VDTSKVRPGQRIAAIAGIVLFIVMWFSWYGVDLDKITGGKGIANLGIDTTANAWQSFSWIDLLMLLTALVAVGAAAMAASGRMSAAGIAPAAGLTTGLGALCTLLILYRLINEPGPDQLLNIKFGAWLGLVASAVVAFGGFRAMGEERATEPAAPTPAPAPPVA